MDMELVPLDTTGIEVYKNMFKHGDIPITFGVVNPWSKLCFVVLDALIILCDHISQTLQLMDVELEPWETAMIGIHKGVLKYTDIRKRFETASLWNWTCCVVLVRTHWRYDNQSYAVVAQRKSRVRRQILAPSVPSCVCANDLSFKICVFQSPHSRWPILLMAQVWNVWAWRLLLSYRP